MIDAVKNEYARRGKPLAYTQWSVNEVRRFMIKHLGRLKEGDDVGVMAKMLPKPPPPGMPSPLPSWVTNSDADADESSPSGTSLEEDESVEAEDYGVTDEGWEIIKAKKDGMYYLCHKKSHQKIELGTPEDGCSWEITTDDDGIEFIGQGNTDLWDETPCREYFCEVKDSIQFAERQQKLKARQTQPPRLRGMQGQLDDDDEDFGGSSEEDEDKKRKRTQEPGMAGCRVLSFLGSGYV